MPLMRSWVESANSADCPFPLNNLPYGVFSTDAEDPRCGVAIGDQILDMKAAEAAGLISVAGGVAFEGASWNVFMARGHNAWAALRARLTALLTEGSDAQAAAAPLLVSQSEAAMHMPLVVSEYTDFYAGRHHATNIGTMFLLVIKMDLTYNSQ